MLMRGSISLVVLIGVLCATLNGAWRLTRQSVRTGKANGSEPTALKSRRGILVSPGGCVSSSLNSQIPGRFRSQAQAARRRREGQRSDGALHSGCAARVMMAIHLMEIVILPDTTYIMIETSSTLRRTFADGGRGRRSVSEAMRASRWR